MRTRKELLALMNESPAGAIISVTQEEMDMFNEPVITIGKENFSNLPRGQDHKDHKNLIKEAWNLDRICDSLDSGKPSNPKDVVGTLKAPLSTVSVPVLAELGVAMLEGALKYGRHNYRVVGIRASVYYDATLRHLFSWWEGEDLDPDSGMNHITKAIASLCVLRDAMIQSKVEDDRPPKSKEFYKELNQKVEVLQKRYADRSPTHYTQYKQTTKEL